jgi:propionyl-CoA carboxylase alpha chain
LAAAAGVNIVPGFMGLIDDETHAAKIAKEIGYPVMIKASAGGGGKGMRIAWNDAEAKEGFTLSKSEAKSSFGDDRIFIEKFVTQPRHIEIQVLGDARGNMVYLGERECSIQRRNQKIIEEAPSPFLDEATRKAMGEQAVALAKSVGYTSAGTVEFIVDDKRNFYFLEMNTRLQVEHPVTELVTGIDIVEKMIRVAAGEKLGLDQSDIKVNGWAIESRVYAEDPQRNFMPSIGRLSRYKPPSNGVNRDGTIVRNDTGVYEGGEISIHYDPMIAKLCTWGTNREMAIDAMRVALDEFEVEGIAHNLLFLSSVMRNERFRSGNITTAFIAEEFKDGFHGVELGDQEIRRLAAIAVCVHFDIETRAAKHSGVLDNHKRSIGFEWVVVFPNHNFETVISPVEGGAQVRVGDGPISHIKHKWTPGQTRGEFEFADGLMHCKIDLTPKGYRLRYGGADVLVKVFTPRVAELAKLMPIKKLKDTSKLLLCPMPGLLRALNIKVGDVVEAGQSIAMVEAMKMENILRAERQAKVKRIAAQVGAILSVDELIVEFE